VHMRNPAKLLAQVGPGAFVSFNLIVGGAFIFLLNPIFWALTTLFLVTHAEFIQAVFPPFVFYVATGMLFIGNFVFVYLNVAGSLQSGHPGLTRYALLSPLYWGLMSWAAWKGFVQLLYRPFYWEKTTHGLDTPTATRSSWPAEFERRGGVDRRELADDGDDFADHRSGIDRRWSTWDGKPVAG